VLVFRLLPRFGSCGWRSRARASGAGSSCVTGRPGARRSQACIRRVPRGQDM